MLKIIGGLMEVRCILGRWLAHTALVLAAVTAAGGAMAAGATIDYRFKGANDGSGPVGRLVAGDANTLYGTTQQGGTHFNGTIFSLKRVGSAWQHKVIYNFAGGADGAFPQGALIISNGVIYGTTSSGGFESATCSGGCGTVFSLTPNSAKTTWTEKVIHRFKGTNEGREPRAGVIFKGTSLYGTTYAAGGASGSGTVYRLTPNSAKTVWSFAALYAFKGGADGGNPEAEVTFIGADLYGLTTRGGIKTGQCSQDSRGCGTFFRLRPKTSVPWTLAILYRFKGTNDGMEPSGPLTLKSNVFYGTTHRGGQNNKGTVFKLTPNSALTAWTEALIYQFKAGNDGKDPQGVIFHAGDLVGAAATDGTAQFAGTIFSLHPVGASWTYHQLDRFTGSPDGDTPSGRLVLSGPVAYGVTFSGGLGNGTVFELFRN